MRLRYRALALAAGLAILGAALPLATVTAAPIVPVTTAASCDPIDPAACLLPFPNDFFTRAATELDTTSKTGRVVNFLPDAMPRNGTEVTEGGEGKPVDPTEWNRNDGFSPGSAVLTYVPGLDLSRTWGIENRRYSEVGPNEVGYFDYRDQITDIDLYEKKDAPIVIINTKTGERHPFWSELDSHPGAVEAGEQLLMMRPARNFEEGTRYVVAMRNLLNAEGQEIPAGPAFAAIRDNAAPLPTEAPRRIHYESDIFPVLEEAGIDRGSLYLAWDFTVASAENIAGRALSIRDQAFGNAIDPRLNEVLGRLGDTDLGNGTVEGRAPAFTVDSTSVEEDGNLRVINGRVTVPNFMDRIQQTEGHVKENGFEFDFPAPGSRLLDPNRDGIPEQNLTEPTVQVPFVCELPLNRGPQNATLYGHGLLGMRSQVGDARKSPGRQGPFFGCAADWWGMSTADAPTVVAILADPSQFPSLPDRAQQGFLNFMFLGRAAIHPDGFATNPAFQTQDGQPLVNVAQDGERPPLYYDGNSQGGIMGGALVALSPDIQRGILGVLGMNYSTLLNRSVDWEGELDVPQDPAEVQEFAEDVADDPDHAIPAYSVPYYVTFQDPIERQIGFQLMQMLWDRGEANGYAAHIAADPYPNTPPHEVMLQAAFSDHQVANIAAEVEAATIGARLMEGLEKDRHWAFDMFLDEQKYPYQGSSLIYWDSGNATPPNGNIPPSQGDDPHGDPRSEWAAGWQEAQFLLTGWNVDVCDKGPYLTDDHPINDGQRSCFEPDWAPGTYDYEPPPGV